MEGEDGITLELDEVCSTPSEAPVPVPAVDPPLRAGSMLGRYLVVEELGSGGMGRVVRAYDPRLRREVALKLLRTTDEDAEARIVREAQAMARLSHPHVVGVYDVERLDAGDGTPLTFIAMEYVPGQTLSRWLRRDKRSWRAVLAAFVQAGRGLAAAHAAGLVHRDFKPSNVLVGHDGRVRVTDFGLVRGQVPPASETNEDPVLAGPRVCDPTLTQQGTVMGTPPYMAPEQHRGEDVDARGDQFAFCVALFQGLFGYRPFEARDPRSLRSQKERGPVAMPRGVGVPAWVRAALRRGLSPRPADRFESMDSLLLALTRRRSRLRKRTVLAASLVAMVGVTVAAIEIDALRKQAACDDRVDALDDTWNATARERVRQGLLATGVGFAASTHARAEAEIDAWAEGWRSRVVATCPGDVRARLHSPHLREQARRCLSARRHALAATIEVLAEADATTAERAIDVVATLPAVEGCADAGWLSRHHTRADEADPDAASQLRQQLDRVTTLRAADRLVDARRHAELALARAAEIDAAPLVARAELALGLLHRDADEAEAATRRLEDAYYRAVAADDVDPAIDAATALVTLAPGPSPALGRTWARQAHALLARPGGDDPLRRAALDHALATLWAAHDQLPRARDHLESAMAIRAEQLGEGHPLTLASRIALVDVLARSDTPDAAAVQLRLALAHAETTHGSEHPRLEDLRRRLVALGP